MLLVCHSDRTRFILYAAYFYFGSWIEVLHLCMLSSWSFELWDDAYKWWMAASLGRTHICHSYTSSYCMVGYYAQIGMYERIWILQDKQPRGMVWLECYARIYATRLVTYDIIRMKLLQSVRETLKQQLQKKLITKQNAVLRFSHLAHCTVGQRSVFGPIHGYWVTRRSLSSEFRNFGLIASADIYSRSLKVSQLIPCDAQQFS